MVEYDADAYQALKLSAAKLAGNNVSLVKGDAQAFIKSDKKIYDIVFVDPPYIDNAIANFLHFLQQRIHYESLVYVEDSKPIEYKGWHVVRAHRAGKVHYGLLKLNLEK